MTIYFAHPAFTPAQEAFKRAFLAKIRPRLDVLNVRIIDPFDYSPNIEDDIAEKVHRAPDILRECLRLLEQCDIIVVLVDGSDAGTAFEAGYAYSVNKPVILISEGPCSSANAMLLGAAKAIIDNVLEDASMDRLAALLIWHQSTISRYPGKPHDN